MTIEVDVGSFLEHFGVTGQKVEVISKPLIKEPAPLKSDLLVDEFLKHYGVIGQKWGVTNRSSGGSSKGSSSPKGGGSSSVKKETSSGDAAALRVAKSKTAHLSNDDLKKVVERMRLDQQYAELSNPRKVGGKAYAGKILKDSGSKLAGAAATALAGILVAAAFSKYSAKAEVDKEILKEGLRTAALAKKN